jgi:hypothetical protein
VPADVHETSDAVFIIDENGGVVLDGDRLDQRGEMAANLPRGAEQIIQQIDAMRSNVV